jgi:asparagine synthetase B (glutamine-hydrolysing)
VGFENPETIQLRHMRLQNPEYIELNHEGFIIARKHLKTNCEEYALRIDNGEQEQLDILRDQYWSTCSELNELESTWEELKEPEFTGQVRKNKNRKAIFEKRMSRIKEVIDFRRTRQMLTDDNGAIGMSHICGIGRSRGELIYISGSGADEIFSDYGYRGIKHFGHSTIGGHFIQDLSKYFPWKNFFNNTQRAYLMKEEYVAGSHGVEGRYPFLDRDVVQEFLWLKPELKNRHYKAPLHQYMKAHNYPFDVSAKVGFNCGFSGSRDGYNKSISTHRTVGEASGERMVVDFSRWGADFSVAESD